jgi:NAD(P)-dependent dehydrogenase (short-subunit alcohol dehydrogenase family)
VDISPTQPKNTLAKNGDFGEIKTMNWTPDQLPDLTGKHFFITGGNSGIGLEAAKILCQKNAHVVISARSQEKAEAALSEVTAQNPDAKIDWISLDLTDPTSIAAAAKKITEMLPTLDALINNAGVMQTPERQTDEGFELQFATNHLGHFRLASALYPHLVQSKGRIVAVSSIAHHSGKINLDDLMHREKYSATKAYTQSKLANLMFAFELDRRLKAAKSPVICIPCHPGYSATNLQTAGVGMKGGNRFLRGLYAILNKIVAQSAERGAYPLVLSAADPTAEGGVYYGPTATKDMRGPVGLSRVSDHARDEDVAKALWEATEALTGPFSV